VQQRQRQRQRNYGDQRNDAAERAAVCPKPAEDISFPRRPTVIRPTSLKAFPRLELLAVFAIQ
jgi:hypothetical protein